MIDLDNNKQYCDRCTKEVALSFRYPHYLCRSCTSLPKLDSSGREVKFYNIDGSGGFQVVYEHDASKNRKDLTHMHCYIDEVECIATEARFGGIVYKKIHYATGLPDHLTNAFRIERGAHTSVFYLESGGRGDHYSSAKWKLMEKVSGQLEDEGVTELIKNNELYLKLYHSINIE